jgi:hypothetical protein
MGMLDGIKRLVLRGGLSPPAHDGSAGVPALPAALIALLRTDLGRLDAAGRGLGAQAFRYVTTGQDGEVLLRIAAADDPAKALLLDSARRTHMRYGKSAERRAFFARRPATGNGARGLLLHRLGEVYAAAFRVDSKHTPRLWPHLPDRLLWLELLVREALGLEQVYYTSPDTMQRELFAEDLEAALVAAGEESAWLVRAALAQEPVHGYSSFNQGFLLRIRDLGAACARHSAATVEALRHPQAAHRAHVANLLGSLGMPVAEALRPELEALWVSSSKTAREAVEKLLTKDKATLAQSLPALQRYAAEGDPGERLNAVLAIGRHHAEDSRALLDARLAVEKSPRVRAEIERILGIATPASEPRDAADAVAATPSYDDAFTPPAAKTYERVIGLAAGFEAQLVARVERFNQRANAEAEEHWDRMDPKWRRGKRGLSPQVSAGQAREVARALAAVDAPAGAKVQLMTLRHQDLLAQELGELVEESALSLPAILRLGFLFGLAGNGKGQPWLALRAHDALLSWIRGFVARQEPALTLLDLAAACDAAGIPSDWIERLYLDCSWGAVPNPLSLPPEAIWPFFATRTEGLAAALGICASPRFELPSYFQSEMRRRAYSILQTFPRPPRTFAGFLWEQALGTSKLERPLAQACLGGYPDRLRPILGALDDGRKDVRASAAEWLGRLGDPEAIGPLKKALVSEKHDEPKAAMMGALETFGVDIDQFLNRKKLLAEAEKGLAKPLPKELEWFPFDALPEVHWEKNRQVVPPAILRWLIVQAFRVKSPEPGALLRRYCALMRPDERQRLGKQVLGAWLEQDTVPRYDHAEAAKLAEQQVAQHKQWAKQYPQYAKDFDEATVRKTSLNHFLHECVGSAIASKGVLAVAGACSGADVVAPVQRYLQEWYGQRAAQCKALLQMLSWVEHPLAIQLVLGVSTRFRTRSIQQEAARLVEAIAERRGWSRDELADRTIPSAGFESDGRQLIDYGTRQFDAKLEEDFSVSLTNLATGKAIKGLPDANQTEDEAAVKALKKQLAAHKKELAQVLKMQAERLYEAMCVEREWGYEDWELYLNQHAIVGRYCQRLVWIAKRGNGSRVTFRPLPDRTLTDPADDPVELAAEDRVRIAHASLLAAEEAAAWTRHFADYAVEPLFPQLVAADWRPTEAVLEATGLKDFEGHLINTFKLRGKAGKLGYIRGAGEDGGWFHTYSKSYPGLQLQAVIEFTGNSLPEESRTAALIQAYFVRQTPDQQEHSTWSHKPIKLRTVPKILLAETRGDLAALAAEGSGFDPEWTKKTSAW